MDGKMKGWIDKWMGEWMDEWLDVKFSVCMFGRMNIWMIN